MSFDLIAAILPILLTLLVGGYALAASRTLPPTNWGGAIEVLSFRLLIPPAVLIRAIAGIEVDLAAYAPPFVFALWTAVGGVVALVVLLLRPLWRGLGVSNPQFTSLFQLGTRWNGFIALAAGELFLGGQAGFAMVAIAMAVLIPVINVGNIVVLTAYGGGRATLRGVVMQLVKNPLIQASVIGLALLLSGTKLPGPIDATLDLIGRGALGVGILAIGAGMTLRRFLRPSRALLLSLILRPGLSLLAALGAAQIFSLTPEQVFAVCMVLTVSAATNGYVVARQMGGDGELYADGMAWQLLLSLALLPAGGGGVPGVGWLNRPPHHPTSTAP